MSIRNHTTISLRVERDTELKKTRTTNCAHVLKKPRRTEIIIIIIIIPFSTYTYNTRVLSRAVFLRRTPRRSRGAADDRERSRRSAGTRRAEITAEREFTEHGARSFSVFSRYAFVEREALVGDGGEGVMTASITLERRLARRSRVRDATSSSSSSSSSSSEGEEMVEERRIRTRRRRTFLGIHRMGGIARSL